MRPTIANQQWKVHSQVRTKHFIWIFYLAENEGFSEQLCRIWHDNKEERHFLPEYLPEPSAQWTLKHKVIKHGWVLGFNFWCGSFHRPPPSRSLGVKHGGKWEKGHQIKSWAIRRSCCTSLTSWVTLGKSFHLHFCQESGYFLNYGLSRQAVSYWCSALIISTQSYFWWIECVVDIRLYF